MPDDDAVTCEKFLQLTDGIVSSACSKLTFLSSEMERAVYEIVEVRSSAVCHLLLEHVQLGKGERQFNFCSSSIDS